MLRATRLFAFTFPFLAAALATVTPAQMSGTYTVDPAGSGSRNFKTFADATYQLFVQGVGGAVVLEIAPGRYTETFNIAPIQGASSTNTVTFKSKTPLGAKLGASTGLKDTIVIPDYTSNFPVEWLVFDGIEFINTVPQNSNGYLEQRAVNARGSTQNIEFRNCKFQATIVDVIGPTGDWSIHHCAFEGHLGFRCVRLSSVVPVEIHNNTFQFDRTSFGIISSGAIPGTARRSRIYNNLMFGDIYQNGAAIRADYSTDIDHNTIHLDSNTSTAAAVTFTGVLGRSVEVRNNILYTEGKGPAMLVSSLKSYAWFSDGNIFHAPQSIQGVIRFDFGTTVDYTTLLSWQQASGQDANSMFADPKLVGGNNVPDRFRLQDGSPAAGAAQGTRSWITTDFAGTTRPTPASIGAFEGKRPTTFIPFGQGCAGTLNNVPRIGTSGKLELGSKDFAVTLQNALGNANAFFAIGVSNTRIGSVSLPVNLGGNCNLLTSSDLLLQLRTSGSGPGNGTASVKFGIPDKPALKGSTLHFQWGVVDQAARGIGLAFSDGATLTL